MSGPLAGIKVLDFSTLLPGPYATMLLADMGADVIRIESPTRPDLLRITPPMLDDRSYAHLMVNRNKRSLSVDLKHKDANALIFKLVANADVLVEQFRPGVMSRLGLDYQTLKTVNPRLIYCAITGYGQTGPMKNKAGHDINYLALSGLASYSGTRSSGPVLSATQIADIAGGSQQAVMAIQGAIIERYQTGKGQFLDISMTDAAFALNTMFGAASLATERDPDLGDEMLNGGSFYGYYQTSDSRYLAVGSLEPQFAQGFFEAIGHPEWLPQAVMPPGQQQTLITNIQHVIANKTLAQWMEVFAGLDVCVEPVLTLNEAAQHRHFATRNMIQEVQTEEGEILRQIAPVVKFDSSQGDAHAGRVLGADSADVLTEMGFLPDEIDDQIESGLVWQAP